MLFINKKKWSTVNPPYQQVLHLQIQSTTDQKYIKKNSSQCQKAKFEFA